MEITRLDNGDTQALDQAHATAEAAFAVDRPGVPLVARDSFGTMLTVPRQGALNVTVLAHVDGKVAGYAFIEMFESDNRHLAEVWGMVAPEHRHKGVGRALLDGVVEVVKEHGRDTIVTDVHIPLGEGGLGNRDGERFCEAAGFTAASSEGAYRLDLSTVDDEVVETLRREAWAKAEGYSLIQWSDGIAGPTPDEVLEGIAELLSSFYGDTPTGTLDVEELAYTPERVQADNSRAAAQNRRTVNTAIRHDASGEVIAWTKIHVRPSAPHYGMQGITMVRKDHRGHRLGMVLKTENLRRLREVAPEVEFVDTGNADDNAPMLAVNTALGYRGLQAGTYYQLKV
ncbi:GNAT family N-acetyltransferase [Phytomonospora endophytica]|uniref:GNAT superfamily N-acetyltransferase n=1 Tax=Phytomonospora endophytica TaxID=714109 RepID=A0A841G0T4_9ACTN|nr:GNAT family N-acetyltransferase [Phytomonospora endophytica]MBB6039382.1 GNAT superfamily N-acetyltransferase [Phytomonospora endophytica]GIG69675.1 GNAT family N-acetyltransferase [Phytomonospora endophytica]